MASFSATPKVASMMAVAIAEVDADPVIPSKAMVWLTLRAIFCAHLGITDCPCSLTNCAEIISIWPVIVAF